jgi:hypothetical protein
MSDRPPVKSKEILPGGLRERYAEEARHQPMVMPTALERGHPGALPHCMRTHSGDCGRGQRSGSAWSARRTVAAVRADRAKPWAVRAEPDPFGAVGSPACTSGPSPQANEPEVGQRLFAVEDFHGTGGRRYAMRSVPACSFPMTWRPVTPTRAAYTASKLIARGCDLGIHGSATLSGGTR